jgi:tetratricopeptide (TPR) repeat protein
LKRAHLLGPDAVAAFWIGSFDSLATTARGARLNTDDFRIAEYRAPRDLIERSKISAGSGVLSAMLPHGTWADARPTFADWSERDWLLARGRQLARSGYFDAARLVAGNAAGLGQTDVARELDEAIDAERAGQAVSRLLPRAREAAEAGRVEESRDLLEQAAAAAPRNARVWILLAEAQRQLGQSVAAMSSLEHALDSGTPQERHDAQIAAGLIEIAAGRPARASERFALARALDPRDPLAYAFEARARFDAGDRAGAQAVLRAGLAMAPDDSRLQQVAAEVRKPNEE